MVQFCPARGRVSVFQVDSDEIHRRWRFLEMNVLLRTRCNRQQPRPLCTARIKLSSV